MFKVAWIFWIIDKLNCQFHGDVRILEQSYRIEFGKCYHMLLEYPLDHEPVLSTDIDVPVTQK
jgi:hypothetical protein